MPKDRCSWRPVGPLGLVTLIALLLAACGTSATPTATTGAAVASSAPTAAPTAAALAPTTAATAGGAATTPAATASTATASASGTVTAASGATPSGAAATAPRASATAATSATRYAIVPTNSKATYRVSETFINQGNRLNVAEGTTGDITGEITIDKTKPSASRVGTIKVDISKLESDSEQRDDQIRARWLESTKFPTATFVPKRLEGLPDTPYTEGAELTFRIIGDLTVRNVTKEVTFDAKGKVVGDLFTGTATTTFNMTDFGFDPPSILGILKAENGVELTLTIEAKRVP
ncbi:MAG TPA: YceI family protein [Thermomicrobiales bacterium]|jgi:polyisoprenoid-binding protein YceI